MEHRADDDAAVRDRHAEAEILREATAASMVAKWRSSIGQKCRRPSDVDGAEDGGDGAAAEEREEQNGWRENRAKSFEDAPS